MDGGIPLNGEITVAGAKNVALKACVAAILTDELVVIHNVPQIRDVEWMLEVVKSLGITITRNENTIKLKSSGNLLSRVPMEYGARLRTSAMVIGPLLARTGEAKIPNPGGCRIGARPIDRHIEGLKQMGAVIEYNPEDGYFYARAKKLEGVVIDFAKNTHTGTETMILAAVLAKGTTVLKNAAAEVEVDDLIKLLNGMGAKIRRVNDREIVIDGVKKLHGTEFRIMPDRNEEVTWAIAAAVSSGEVIVRDSRLEYLGAFIKPFVQAGGRVEKIDETTTKYSRERRDIQSVDIITAPYPGFMTDWQAPWAVLMTQANGVSTIHETVFESRFSYVGELKKMGAMIDFYDPVVTNPESYYNFNWTDRVDDYHQGIRISGPIALHNAVVTIDDLRAGATLILAALTATGESYIHGAEQVDRGYEKIEVRLRRLGARIRRVYE